MSPPLCSKRTALGRERKTKPVQPAVDLFPLIIRDHPTTIFRGLSTTATRNGRGRLAGSSLMTKEEERVVRTIMEER